MKPTLLKIINPILLLLAVNQFATGFNPRLYGKNTFKFSHKQMAIVLLIALAAHLGLNNAWIRHTYFQKKRKPSRANVASEDRSVEFSGSPDVGR